MKKNIRKDILQKRMGLSKSQWQEKSQFIFSHLTKLEAIKNSQTVMIFMDFRNEVSTTPIIEWLFHQKKQVIIPRVKKGHSLLELCIINDFSDMSISSLGIREPKASHNHFALAKDIDFVCMPGVAFTKEGARLGYGGGYYDRLVPLMKKRPPLVALAFELQMVESLPLEPHDIFVDLIVTESGVLSCSC